MRKDQKEHSQRKGAKGTYTEQEQKEHSAAVATLKPHPPEEGEDHRQEQRGQGPAAATACRRCGGSLEPIAKEKR